jgi:hypothetical protein
VEASEFINIYGNVGYLLRNNGLNTPGRVSMLASLVYLQSTEQEPPDFDVIYNNSLDFTEEKLELASFKSFISKLEAELNQGPLIKETDDGEGTIFQCSPRLVELLERADKAFTESLTRD